MAATLAAPAKPKSVSRPKHWSVEVEEAYRFQIAGYRDAVEYGDINKTAVERWPHNNYVKKLQRKDGYFVYFNKTRECADKDVNKCKMYGY
ncbi:meiosis expressed gene 1 protein homolog [Exaiptasia diaphana]|uniref:Meiosis expressed gene 1 protein homolog n=1 Tax=Exaiptasia diaphana TaxID=2652724 RepID=A0A913X5B9_EXADI|nr:meiosis expressed gene 1 protein homolog [Exaiptasia diaphana]XP_020911136.1 meiosis expressed gene 1 protein homolog [Exaiptasia diaphana]KXJ08376.1 Meiosis expressed gene 1 protein-like [Exaiptasia diaphana]KXJ15119.1 Meiosis expressed gene 1 protein-like [Exaiptasia diaphana]